MSPIMGALAPTKKAPNLRQSLMPPNQKAKKKRKNPKIIRRQPQFDNTMKFVVRAPNWIGDSILTIPALQSLRTHFPEAEIWIAAREWVADIFSGFEFIQGIIPLQEHSHQKSLRAKAAALKAHQFDAGLLLTNSFASSLMFFLARIPERWGYNQDGRRLFLTKAVARTEAQEPRHQVYDFLHLVSELGINPLLPELTLPLNPDEILGAERFLSSQGFDPQQKTVVLNPGAYYGSAKRWPISHYRNLAELLQKHHSANLIIVGSSQERPLAEQISTPMPKKPLILSGKTTLRQLAAIISRASLFITNDSGPMHMANALKIPTIAIFGPTDPRATGPFQQPSAVFFKQAVCWPCFYRECPFDHRCMTSIGPEEVYAASKGFLI